MYVNKSIATLVPVYNIVLNKGRYERPFYVMISYFRLPAVTHLFDLI